MPALRAALIYALAVFAVGFALGVARIILLVPRFGETASVLIELPFMLAASWSACGAVLKRTALPPSLSARGMMGALAFAMLIGLEAIVGLVLMRLSAGEFFARFSTPPGALGLLGQIAFAAFPMMRRRR